MFGERASFLLALCSLAASLAASYGQSIRVSFGEVDYSVSEREDHVDVSVSTLGNVAGDLTYIITPLSLGQAAALYDYHIDEELDSAEPGEDFSSEVIVRTVQPGSLQLEEDFTIDLMGDDILENDEVFLLRLDVNATDASDREKLEFTNQWTIIRIRADSDESSIAVAVLRGDVRESDGVIENFITITKEGQSEIPLEFSISVNSGTATNGADFMLEAGDYSLQPEEYNRTFPLTILEDAIPEATESIRFTVEQSIYSVNIMDNDNVTVGFTSDTELVVEEGKSLSVCVGVISPQEVARDVVLQGTLVPGTARDSSDYEPTSTSMRGFLFHITDTLPRCEDIRTINDDIAEMEESFTFKLSTIQPDGLIIVEPDTTTIRVTDSDVPQLQAEVTRTGSSSPAATVEEGEGTSDDFIRIFTADPHPNPVQLTVTVNSSNAESGQDFMLPTGTFTFFPDNTSLFLPLTVFEDEFVEIDEEFTVTVSQPGTSHPPLTITVTINDNDPVTVGFANDTVLRVAEGATVRVCGKVVDVASSSVQRLIVLEGHTIADTAEGDSDFTPLAWNYTFSSSATFMCVSIATGGDDVPEVLETFSVSLQPLGPSRLVTVQPDSLTIEIVNDDVPQLEVEVVGSSSLTATVGEGDGLIGNLLRVFTTGIHPFELMYTISVAPSGGSDFTVTEGPVSFSPNDTEHFIPLSIREDGVAEEDETLTITVFQAGFSSRTISITIQDNDELRVGFTNGSRVSVEEGGGVTLCARILSPELVERSVRVQARTVQFTAIERVDYTPAVNGWTLDSSLTTVCMDIQTTENSKPEHPREFQVRLQFEEPSRLLRLDPATVTVEVLDNDGTPLAPRITDVKLLLQEDGKYNLTFAWSAKVEELRPIDSFTGTVTALNLLEKEEGERKRESAGEESRRERETEEDEVVSQTPPYSFQVDSNTTEHTVVAVRLAEEYVVQVCSKNKLGFNCSVPVTHSSGFLRGGVTVDEESDELAPGVIVAIVILLLLVLCCCCFFCFGLFFFLCCYREDEKAYYPEEKEKKNEEAFAKYRAMEEDVDSDSGSELGYVV